MSLRYLLKFRRLPIIPAFVLGVLGCSGIAFASSADTGAQVQTYVNQAVPAPLPSSQEYYDSPLAAGTLTLQDVLAAHRPVTPNPGLPALGATPSATATAPLLTPPSQSSATGLMLSQGMKDVLQKIGKTAVASVQAHRPPASSSPSVPAASTLPVSQAQGQPTGLAPVVAPVPAATSSSAASIQYQPGEEPRNLAALVAQPAPAAAAAVPSTAVSTLPAPAPASVAASAAAPDQTCDQHVKKWEKTCSEAGYPATFVGKIVGETRTGCADGALHDVWVTNSCAPPDLSAQTAKADGACGAASDNGFDEAPAANLCAKGIPSAVSGDGPWTWACSGVNGGTAAACVAPKRVPPSNGACGSANGSAVDSAPSDDLCDTGTATPVKGNGPWTWSCQGAGGGNSESCIAPSSRQRQASSAPAPVESAATVSSPLPDSSASVAAPMAKASSVKPDLCGPAAETLAYEAPDRDLCRAGTASVVNGDGPWTWSCTTNEGAVSTCRTLSLSGGDSAAAPSSPSSATEAASPSAPETTVAGASEIATAAPPPVVEEKLACGPAASQPAMQAPTVDLCQGGKASKVRGSNPWHWTCRARHKKVSCRTPTVVDGVCGPANGATVKSAPFAGLCASGAPSGIDGTGPWNWTCSGSGGGVDARCAAALQKAPEKIDGTCGSADGTSATQAPGDNLCASGTPSAISGDGPWSWACSGLNGGAVSSCSVKKIPPPKPPGPPVNGLCGAANGAMATSQPSSDLCASGEVSGPVGNGPWNWSCIGFNGGMTVSCTAPLQPPPPINGVCGDANGVTTLVKPQSGLCTSGILGTVNGDGPWTWTCSGANGGTPASCIAPVAGKVGPMPSTMMPVNGATTSSTAHAPAGLVTPRLPSSDNVSSLDREVLPSLTPSPVFAKPPAASEVPAPAAVVGNQISSEVPALPQGMEPVQPPSFHNSLPSAPVLQESQEIANAGIPGNHLTLDPTISTVLFTHGSGNIDAAVLPALNKLAIVLKNNPDARISLMAYADNTGSTPRDARRLSLTRALAVRTYLSSRGVSESRIDVHAEGANTTSGYMDRVDVKVND